MTVIAVTLLSPVILFFVLGALAAFARSDLEIPDQVAKGMSLYLMASIGLKGGIEVSAAGFDPQMLTAGLAGTALSFGLPFIGFALLRSIGQLSALDAGAVAAHYGSVSVVTFVTGAAVLDANGDRAAGWMVAVLALMETPAIIAGLMLARGSLAGLGRTRNIEGFGDHSIWREVLLNGPVVLLVGAFLIGIIAGKDGYAPVSLFFTDMFRGVLCLFLLSMGLLAARRLREARNLTSRLAALAILLPLLNAGIGLGVAAAIGLSGGTAAAFIILCASASYIAAPAAMSLALPKADAGLYLAMSLAITFPFNIIVGIPLYMRMAALLG
ncbi:MAG: sodium-dependent bicarbonate transport family permease [Thermaurantiacus tibetensis]|uniref:sodium-dependent bicarbonate transport family permease n=1 Tax=Thermaurantiacus tibetensis TaxID=2759035 RepID=UPI002E29F3A3|nr:sodium-dependent bicarbonate transport family permease [Thermaurantiacus tibetensis]